MKKEIKNYRISYNGEEWSVYADEFNNNGIVLTFFVQGQVSACFNKWDCFYDLKDFDEEGNGNIKLCQH